MSEIPFTNCRLKIHWAKEHFKTLEAEIQSWVQSEPLKIVREQDEVGRNFTIFVEMLRPPPRDKLALIAGDCMHNLRSSLDNLVYDIAALDTGVNPPVDKQNLQFPIGRNRDGFKQQEWRIKSLSSDAKAL